MRKFFSILLISVTVLSGLLVSCNKEEEAKPITEKPKDFAGVQAGESNDKQSQADAANNATTGPPKL